MQEKYTAIAKTGTFRDSEGRRHTFTKSDLEKIASNYNTSETDAPLVIGHVKSDAAPAYGWVEKLFCENDKLFAQFSYVSDDVKNLVYKGSYKNVSMSVDMENHRLLHVALLGAAAPAIDGLGAINLSTGNGSIFNFETTNKENQMNEQELQKKILELEAQLQELKNQIQKANQDKEAAEKKVEETQAEFSAYMAKQQDEARKKRVEKLVRDGKLEPAKQEEVFAFASQLAKSSADFSFGSEKISMEEKYFRELEAQKQAGVFANFSNAPAHSQQNQTTFNPYSMTDKL